jgi:chaperonin GroES
MNLKPLGDRVIVKAVEQEQVTASGLVLPDTAKERPQRGKVLAVGDGRWGDDGARVPLGVQVGDEIIYAKYGGTEIKLEGEDVLILQEHDILATVTNGAAPAEAPAEAPAKKPRATTRRTTKKA